MARVDALGAAGEWTYESVRFFVKELVTTAVKDGLRAMKTRRWMNE